jgi:hypothetical protein
MEYVLVAKLACSKQVNLQDPVTGNSEMETNVDEKRIRHIISVFDRFVK